MNIIVSTFNNSKNNYGAVFQSCALSQFLRRMEFDVHNVTLEDRGVKRRNIKSYIKSLVKKTLLLPHLVNLRRREAKFKDFVEHTQNQIKYKTRNELYNFPPVADVYISGSDQVWNPISMHEDLFLSYAPRNSKKISYAASMGNEVIPLSKDKRFGELISEYSSISVREDTMIDVIKRYTNKSVTQNIDPVFLKTKEEWERLENVYKKIKFDKYILVYAIEWNSEFNNRLKDLKKKTGLPVVSINIGNIKRVCADQIIYDASPAEFLYLLHKSQLVVATSFHGIALSIIYNKTFMPIAGTEMPSRIESLMRHFEIDVSMGIPVSPDYVKINKIILEDQEQSKNYLINAIYK